MHELIRTWRRFRVAEPPHVLASDRAVLLEYGHRKHYGSWERYIAHRDFLQDSSDLHLDLLPVPYVGNLGTASIFFLLLNPGFSPVDYYAEYKVRAFREAHLKTLRQTHRCSFIGLEPRFSWSGAFGYWQSKLHETIKQFSMNVGIPYGHAHAYVRKNIAALELFPYHSQRFQVPKRVMRRLPSVQLMRGYVHDVLGPRAEAGEILIVATRRGEDWDLRPSANVIVYQGGHTRGAHISPNTGGGAAMLQFLGELYTD